MLIAVRAFPKAHRSVRRAVPPSRATPTPQDSPDRPDSPPPNPAAVPVHTGAGRRPPGNHKGLLIALAIVLGALLLSIPTILYFNGLIANAKPGGGDAIVSSPSFTVTETPAATESGSTDFRDNYTTILGGGADTYTVMIYICGSDLESDAGCASIDIGEILAANFGDNVNVVLQTGGCYSWAMSGMADGEVQRWAVEDGQLVLLQDLGQTPMLTSSALGDFIDYTAYNYPANRYALIFWDHGGGSLYGYGYDEIYPDTGLFLTDIDAALSSSGVKFDFVGFDACLMGTIETAYMLEPYADYMIGSEETEPADGWYYTPWLTALGQNTSVDTVSLSSEIVDSYIAQNGNEATLSVVSLREIPYVYSVLCDYMENATLALLTNKEFNTISAAVSNTKTFAEGDYDLIDIVDFTNQSDIAGEDELIEALDSAVKYRNNCERSGVYGLSLYFPYTDVSVYGYAKELFSAFGFGGPVYEFYDSFVNILAGGQTYAGGQSLEQSLTGEPGTGTDFAVYDWYNEDMVESYDYDDLDYTELEIYWDDYYEYYYLPLTDEDWDLITNVEMQILLDDGEGYIDLGSDQYFETDDYGNLILNYGADNTWVSIGGQVVCYYAEDIIYTEDDSIFIGYVPAILNGDTYIEIILEWDGVYGDGYIAGYRLTENHSTIGGAGTTGKGYKSFYQGDVVEFLCDYYLYDGTYDGSYYFGEPLVIGDVLPAVTYEDVGDDPVLECYMIVDIYQNYAWTETVVFSY